VTATVARLAALLEEHTMAGIRAEVDAGHWGHGALGNALLPMLTRRFFHDQPLRRETREDLAFAAATLLEGVETGVMYLAQGDVDAPGYTNVTGSFGLLRELFAPDAW
jgi:hypothetical protein